jgi:hypothetical protein
MNRKTLIAIGSFAVLSLLAFVTLRSPDKGERTGERPRPIAKLKAGDFNSLDVVKAGVTTTIRKEGDKYRVVAPVTYAADDTLAKAAFEALEKADFGDVVTEQASKHAEFEVDDKGLHIVARKDNAAVADLIIGKAMGSGTMVRTSGKNEVWQASGLSKFTFDKGTTDWRDKSITTFTPADAEKIEIKSKDGGTIALKKVDKGDKKAPGAGEDQWEIAADSSTKIAKLDTGIAPGIVAVMSNWKTNDFADAAKPEDTGLADPALTVTVSLKGGKAASVAIGKKKGEDDFYVKSGDAPQVFLVKKYNIERVNKRPIDFNDKTVCDINDADLAEVAVTHGAESYTLAKSGSEWKVTKPAKTDLDTTKVPSITGSFKAWKATGFAETSDPKAAGLAKPQAVVVAKGKSASCTLKIGDESKDKQSYFAQTGSSPYVYTLAKWATDRVLVKVADIKKATVAKK